MRFMQTCLHRVATLWCSVLIAQTRPYNEIKRCFEELSDDENCRSIVLSGEGKVFTAGIDISALMEMASLISGENDVARKAKNLLNVIRSFQDCLSALELCKKPVLAAVHSLCIGAGVDLISAADIRYCSKDAVFQVKEVDVGLAADVGTLQRLPKIIHSESLARELCYTARKMLADEALSCGLVSRVFGSKDEMIDDVIKVAETIAKKSPVAVQGTKRSMVFSRDHSVQEGLEHIAMWNQIMLQSEDLVKAASSAMSEDKDIVFSKL
ncbi:unnamed protein product [Acanthoscelides obtectus]|uniref:Delta(3,5)-Delta(2,4)-dienoyl-CoA isomerase, mitochondrial n=1 Tax=Acanthoscelides obtectus TaxID=200917 RepID=A0A9P0JX42_ACAOB|nr:unnamed protein product [Acanthoscelides obtectus]CAH1982372.1 unnamed protein product [Acanthoscelides obtectus]CAK1639152.1 Delta(3,5)-Delta(2,4)-dienoyl-CoA isomerase, mitochondrial [Acanthoscelides obtectus]CAK1639204.1 Delta(3,5)-Delta(2,4)-dienoyl-CoA isomerase, mitochondrial [Acanthoscelides obtectus]